MRRLIWSPRAIRHLQEIRDYIARDDAVAAARIRDRLIAASNSLRDYPHRGRPVRTGIRRISTVYPYVLYYRVTRDEVRVIDVIHGARLR